MACLTGERSRSCEEQGEAETVTTYVVRLYYRHDALRMHLFIVMPPAVLATVCAYCWRRETCLWFTMHGRY